MCLVLALALAGSIAAILHRFPVNEREENRPLRNGLLPFTLVDYSVPKGETWRLSWKSPYHSFEIVPAYDIRVINGSAYLGPAGGIQANAFNGHPGKTGRLDLSAVNDAAIVWLQEGTRFSVANERLEIKVCAFSSTTKSLKL